MDGAACLLRERNNLYQNTREGIGRCVPLISIPLFQAVMKIIINYEDHNNTDYHKSLKITLPKSWKVGTTNKLLETFVENYNANEDFASNKLDPAQVHLAIRQQNSDTEKTDLEQLASDAIILDVIPDRADVYLLHGPSQTLQERKEQERNAREEREKSLKNTVQCTHFGCKNRFPKGGPYPECIYHKSPPVFHETAKFWSCCPHKKAYDWDDFQAIPGCQTGMCTEVKQEDDKLFLGGTDLREAAGEAAQLKSIDDFNKAQAAGGSEAAPVLERLQRVLEELGVERELYQQVVDGMKKDAQASVGNEAELLQAVKIELGKKMKDSFKSIAASQLRIS